MKRQLHALGMTPIYDWRLERNQDTSLVVLKKIQVGMSDYEMPEIKVAGIYIYKVSARGAGT